MDQNKSIRSRLIDLKPGNQILFVEGRENTIRNTACVVGGLTGKKFTCRKVDNGIMVYRYE